MNALTILSTGAPKGGVAGCADAFGEQTGRAVEYSFVTAPVLRQMVAGGTRADVIVCPAARMDEFERDGRVVPGIRSVVGSVKAGVVVRKGARIPDISSAESLRAEILAADSIVYNIATSGAYIVRMMARLGVADAIESRVTRVPNGAGVMLHLAGSAIGNEFGFGQLTEIRVHEERGVNVALVGPLPRELANVTTYCAAVFADAADPETARALVEFMGGEEGREICRSTGLEF